MAELPAISLASTIIGFISFSLTVAIWLNSFWEAFLTIAHAPSQIQDELKLHLVDYEDGEEAEYLRRLRHRERRPTQQRRRDSYRTARKDVYGDGGPVRVLSDAVRDLVREFKAYERPFLVLPGRGPGEEEKNLEWSFDATKARYRCDLTRRLVWLRARGGVGGIAARLDKMQTHRAAMESTECRLLIMDTMGLVRDCEERMLDMEDRMRVIEDRLLGARVVRAAGI